MTTKVLAIGLGITRSRQRPLVEQSTGSFVAASAPSVLKTKASGRSTQRNATNQHVRLSSTHTLSTAIDPAAAAEPVIDAVSVPSDMRQKTKNGQCSHCRRFLSLTSAGMLHSHGHGCPGSSQLPVEGSVKSGPVCSRICSQESIAPSVFTGASSTADPSQLSADIVKLLRELHCRVLKRVPKASRTPAADKLAETLRQIVVDPDNIDKWRALMSFTFACFSIPGQRGGKRNLNSLASKINAAIASFPDVSEQVTSHQQKKSKSRPSSDFNLASRVSSKLEDGDIRGAIRLAASDDALAPFDDVTADGLRLKHPSRAVSTNPPPSPTNESCLFLHQADILAAIKSFMPGSASGPDGLRPQHLKDLTGASAGEAGQRLLYRLTEFTNLCLSGRVPAVVQPVFCGATLCAINKKDGGIRPIAVGNTLRRMIAKAACKAVTVKMAANLLPVQIGFGVPRSTEAAVHAARSYVTSLQPDQGLLKLDFKNAFNTLSRDNMFQIVHEQLPELYPFIHMCYKSASFLNFGEHQLLSDEGIQQGDPLGPLLFCATSLKLACSIKSEFNVWYLDDGSIGGNVESLLLDLETVRRVGPTIGLILNEDKCEIITDDVSVIVKLQAVMPKIRHIRCSESELLGAPIGDETAVNTVLSSKLAVFNLLASRLKSLNAHDGLFLLKNCFSIPKLLYLLRCSACYKSSLLAEYDDVIRQTLNVILNIDLSDVIWKQATLPVSSGGLGIRLAVDLALPAFLSSCNGASDLTLRLLPSRLHAVSGNLDPVCTAACLEWKNRYDATEPDPVKASVQKAWDAPVVSSKREEVLSSAQDQAGRARLLAATAPHSGDFLHAVPCSSIGTRLDDTSLRIAISLRLGAQMCAPHTCICGQLVDSSGVHGLACRKSAGRHVRHNAVNDIIKRALASADVPSMLEPSSLCRDDGKRPDGLTVLPWANGRCLVWDFTCPDTLATSHLNRAVLSHGTVANDAESKKTQKYRSLGAMYSFKPIAIETLGALGDEASLFFRDLGRRIADVSREPRSYQFLMQRLSVTVQRGNAACILGTAPASVGLDELFYI